MCFGYSILYTKNIKSTISGRKSIRPQVYFIIFFDKNQ